MILDKLKDILKGLVQLAIQQDAMRGFCHMNEPFFFGTKTLHDDICGVRC